MTNTSIINTALILALPEIEALQKGRMIAAMSNMFITPGRKFALCSKNNYINPFTINGYYHHNFVNTNKNAILLSNYQGILVKSKQSNLSQDNEQLELPLIDDEKTLTKIWGKCELCQIIDNQKDLIALSKLTIWSKSALEQILIRRKNIFLVYLRVYHLSQSIEILLKENKPFIALPKPLTISDTNPVLPDKIFATRKRQLEKLEPPQHPELEELLNVLSPQAVNNSKVKQLESDIHRFLGWNYSISNQQVSSEFDWIKTISELGDRTQEQKQKKSHYQAGTDFENITRKALEFLGFKIDENHKGGAGGLDLYCSEPYPLVIECKSGKSIPSRTVEELIKLGLIHLGKDEFFNSSKLIIGPNYANPTSDTLKAAKEGKVSIIKAMSLQKLVELKAQYPGSINLIELKAYLEAGVIDYKIQEYINQVQKDIQLRSHLVESVKNFLQNSQMDSTGIEALHGAYVASNPPQTLKINEIYEILIELSSPLTGYLGRTKGTDWKSDKFYFLRDLTNEVI